MSGERTILKAKRRTRAQVQKLVEEFRGSGMRRIDFCRERGLSLTTLARQLRKSKKRDRDRSKRIATTNSLVQVEIAGVRSSPHTLDSGLAVVVAGGRRV